MAANLFVYPAFEHQVQVIRDMARCLSATDVQFSMGAVSFHLKERTALLGVRLPVLPSEMSKLFLSLSWLKT